MEVVYVYQKKRNAFGKQPIFSDRLGEISTAILPNPSYMKNYVERTPKSTETQATPDKSEHEVDYKAYFR
jgi:dynein intermediate chain 2, axonemal